MAGGEGGWVFNAIPYKCFKKAYGNTEPSFCWEFGKNTTSEPVCYKFAQFLLTDLSRSRGDCSTDHTPTVPPQTLGSLLLIAHAPCSDEPRP